jgi:hypothetical protein
MARMVERDPETSGTDIDGEVFLVKAGVEDIHHLDVIASGLWRFLEHPRPVDELEAVFRAAFPDVRVDTIRQDLSRALDNLMEAGYLRFQDTNAERTDATNT